MALMVSQYTGAALPSTYDFFIVNLNVIRALVIDADAELPKRT